MTWAGSWPAFPRAGAAGGPVGAKGGWEEALFFFEAFLLSAAGALDGLARYCHLSAGLSGGRQNAGWRKERWRVQLLAARGELEPVMGESQTRLRATNDVIGILRNYIH